MAITAGTVGPGGAKFGGGGGGDNRFDHTQLYAGLWSIGIDPNSPTVKQDVQRWYDSQPANVKAEVQKGMGNQPGRGSIDPLVYAVDWRQRDVGRKIQKENGIFDVGIGKILGEIAPYAAAFLPGGQWIAPAVGATIGGVKDGWKGAIIGGAKGYMAGQAAPGISSGFSNAGGWSTLTKAPLTFASNVGRSALTSAQNYIPGMGGNVAQYLSGGAAAANLGRNALSAATTAANMTGGGNGNSLTNQVAQAAVPLVGAALSAGSGSGNDAYDQQLLAARNAEAQRQGIRAQGVSNANATFANQDDYYDRLRGSIFDYQKTGLDEDRENQQRELKFELARRGHLGGSQEVDAIGDLQRLYSKGVMQAGSLADDARNRARSADQAAKAQAIRDISLDVDSGTAISNAVSQSQLAAQQAADAAKGQDVGDVFNSLGYLYQQGQIKKDQSRGVRDYYAPRGAGAGVGMASSQGGTIFRGV